eukprot:CAMPEP_0171185482 /NCGR_PEP_ID=MMETSP0790-20130122/16323_1 /TAXON_ID=2925 /ORGANISM="Alexandrium catenella, Strain OF101" /LENGTH=439 /DNA_ID=CAMNT_0011650503 /DNA_START=1 /DNA_END=1320 /DNA_ORIENTATION=+
MYTVVDQYIKPLTQRAGGMSWALLHHPEGLRCDLFISHGWAEGAFEFIDKALNSWPTGKHHAYICIFANPQNLDISDMIREPRTSPFAKALEVASHVMVVPNSTCGIYTRVWCAYEAWLGYHWEKIIFTATAKRTACSRVREVLLSLAVGFAVQIPRVLLVLLLALHDDLGVKLQVVSLLVGTLLYRMVVLVVLTSFTQCYRRAAAKELRMGYTSVAEARATVERDRDQIFQDIGASAADVDCSIGVLLRTGVSTPGLRNLVAAGLAPRRLLDPLHFPWLGWLYLSLCVLPSYALAPWGLDGGLVSLSPPSGAALPGVVSFLWGVSNLFVCLAIPAMWLRGGMDRRAIVREALNNAAILCMLIWVIALVIWAVAVIGVSEHEVQSVNSASLGLGENAVAGALLYTVVFVTLALERPAALPLLGRVFVQLLLRCRTLGLA